MKTALLLMTAVACLGLGACHRDHVDHDEVGRTKTTTKSMVDTPEGKRTVTETREKNTTINAR
jgi:hypothetical protein